MSITNVSVCACARACSLAYPACNAHTPYIVICGLSGSTTFFDLCVKRHDYRKKTFLIIKCELLFSLQLLPETFLILRGILARYRHKRENIFM
jgi:hypothetical protein